MQIDPMPDNVVEYWILTDHRCCKVVESSLNILTTGPQYQQTNILPMPAVHLQLLCLLTLAYSLFTLLESCREYNGTENYTKYFLTFVRSLNNMLRMTTIECNVTTMWS